MYQSGNDGCCDAAVQPVATWPEPIHEIRDGTVPSRQRGVVQALFDPLALWQAQCKDTVQGLALPAGHFMPEELPAETAAALHGFFGAA